MNDPDLNPKPPEINLNITMEEVKAVPRVVRSDWNKEAADDLRRLMNRLLPGDYVLDKLTGRVVKVVNITSTYDMIADVEGTYKVEDVLNGGVYSASGDRLYDPLNEMEVLAHIRSTS